MTRWKLTKEQRLEMVEMIKKGDKSDEEIGVQFGLDRTTVLHHRIKLGIRYDNVLRRKYFYRKRKAAYEKISNRPYCPYDGRKYSWKIPDVILIKIKKPILKNKFDKITLEDINLGKKTYADYTKIEKEKNEKQLTRSN